MSVVRRFLIAPALVRLIRKERGSARVTEGYFPPQGGRTSYVRVEGQACHLVLVTTNGDGASEERTDVPRAHGDALLDVCAGKAAYDRTAIVLGQGREAVIDRYITPGALDLVGITFENPGEAASFVAPAWFGIEVTSDPAYERHAIALQGPKQAGDVALSNAALDAVLDLIEPRFGFSRYGAQAKANEGDGVVNALRRMAGNGGATAAPQAAAAPEPEAPAQLVAEAPAQPVAEAPADSRIDDVIESLSQALGAAIQPPPQAPEEDDGFERWTVRPRRSQQT